MNSGMYRNSGNLVCHWFISQLPNHFEILHKAWKGYWPALYKISKWLGDLNVCYGWMWFCVIWVKFLGRYCIWVWSRNCGCLVTWFCYQLIAKSGNKTATFSWPDPYCSHHWDSVYCNTLCTQLFSWVIMHLLYILFCSDYIKFWNAYWSGIWSYLPRIPTYS